MISVLMCRPMNKCVKIDQISSSNIYIIHYFDFLWPFYGHLEVTFRTTVVYLRKIILRLEWGSVILSNVGESENTLN